AVPLGFFGGLHPRAPDAAARRAALLGRAAHGGGGLEPPRGPHAPPAAGALAPRVGAHQRRRLGGRQLLPPQCRRPLPAAGAGDFRHAPVPALRPAGGPGRAHALGGGRQPDALLLPRAPRVFANGVARRRQPGLQRARGRRRHVVPEGAARPVRAARGRNRRVLPR
ncbi:hypothetical protein H632_c5151p0, partial [Helicosporidium sp. ATCC 50920]